MDCRRVWLDGVNWAKNVEAIVWKEIENESKFACMISFYHCWLLLFIFLGSFLYSEKLASVFAFVRILSNHQADHDYHDETMAMMCVFFFFFRELHNCIYKICKDCCCVSMRYLLNKESNHIYKKKLGKKITSTVSKCLTDSVDLWLYKRLIRYLDKHTHKVLSDAKKSDRMTIAVLTAGYSEHSLESTTILIEDKNCKQYFISVDWVRKLLIKMGKRQHQKDKM